jgi:hypothetical protein
MCEEEKSTKRGILANSQQTNFVFIRANAIINAKRFQLSFDNINMTKKI